MTPLPSLKLLSLFGLSALLLAGCERPTQEPQPIPTDGRGAPAQNQKELHGDTQEGAENRQDERDLMIKDQIQARGLEDPAVLDAMASVQRHLYVPPPLRPRAYEDSPLPIGFEQTISQPYIVALMSSLLEVSPGQKVLEIGTGSGYQAAVLAEMGAQVFTIELICELAERALGDLIATGYDSVKVRCGDGYKGWPEEAPFDRIIVTAAPPEIPQALIDQLADEGLMVIPVGEDEQVLQVVRKDGESQEIIPVRFVPMIPGQD